MSPSTPPVSLVDASERFLTDLPDRVESSLLLRGEWIKDPDVLMGPFHQEFSTCHVAHFDPALVFRLRHVVSRVLAGGLFPR